MRLFPKVYVVGGSPRTWFQRLVAASAWAKRGYAFSHGCAARLWGFEHFKEYEVVEITIARSAELPPPEILHRVQRLRVRDLGEVEGLSVTSVTRTLVDLAASCAWEVIEPMVNEALRRRRTSLDRLEVALRHTTAPLEPLRELVHRYSGGDPIPESVLESKVLALFAKGGLPKPVKQKRIVIDGKLRRLDFYVPGTALVVEADGFAYHSYDLFEDDRGRDNDLGGKGIFGQRWTWRSIHQRPETLIENARRIIALGTRTLSEAAP
ncbi:MAG: hypothetical protein QM723_17735 [Myxococcaceae bacterium]